MRRLLTLLACLVLLPAALLAAEPAKLVVLNTRAERRADRDLAGIVTQLVVDAASKAEGLQVTSEADLSGFLDDGTRKQLRSCDDDTACLVEVGGALGSDWFLSTSLGGLGDSYVFALRVLSARDGTVAARVSARVDHTESALDEAVCPRVQELLGVLAKTDSRVKGNPRLCQAPLPRRSPDERPAVAPEPAPSGPAPISEAPRAASLDFAVALRGELDLAPPLLQATSSERIRKADLGGTVGLAASWGPTGLGAVVTFLLPNPGLRLEARYAFESSAWRPYATAGLVLFRDAVGGRGSIGLDRRVRSVRLFADLAYELFASRSDAFNVNPILLGAGVSYAF